MAERTSESASVLLGVLAFLICLLLQFRPIDDADIFTQIVLGKDLDGARSYLATDFADWNPGRLAQKVFATLYAVGGWTGVKLFHGALFSAAFILAGAAVLHSRHGSLRLFSLAAATALGVLVGLSNSSVRPQGVALCSFGVLLYLLETQRLGYRAVAGFFALALIWQNFHPSVMLGLALVGCYVLADLPALLRRRRHLCEVGPKLLLCMLLASTLFLTPLGMDIFALSARNLQVSRELLGVSEWLVPWHPRVRHAMIGFWIGVVITCVGLFGGRPRVSWGLLLAALVFGACAFRAARFALFWGVVMVPVWALQFEALLPPRVFRWRSQPLRVTTPRLGASALLVLAVLLGAACHAPRIDPELPVDAVEMLEARMPEGRIYNYREWGGILQFYGSPRWQVHLDGRLYRYSDDVWREYNAAARGTIDAQTLAERFEVDAFFLHRGFHPALTEELDRAAGWERIYDRPPCAVYVAKK